MPVADGGFEEVTSHEGMYTAVRNLCVPHGRTETVSLTAARGRVATDTIRAPRPAPHYDRAAMDGYAVRAADTFDASERSPVRLQANAEPVEPGQAVPVNTGSALPDGADAVVMIEHVDSRDEGLAVYDAVSVGENVAPAGEDVDAGQQLVEAGDRLAPQDIALVRATGLDTVEVAERPRVTVVPTGEEVVESDPGPGEVVETNGQMVGSLAEVWGGKPIVEDIVTDDEDALAAAVRSPDADLVVTTGGSSVGERDLLPDVVAEIGSLDVHGVAIQPGHPVGLGTVEETPILLLPGYPVSCYLNAVQFLRPALAGLEGTTAPPFPTVAATLTTKLRSEPGTRTFARVTLENTEHGTPEAEPLAVSGAGVLSGVVFADGWVEIPEQREGIPAGETVSVQQWDWAWRPS